MKNTIPDKEEVTPSASHPLKIKQALAAIELGKTDQAVFTYFKFMANIIPIEQKTFVHVIPNMSLLTSFYQKTEDAAVSKYELKERLAEELSDTVNQYFPNQSGKNNIVVLEGSPLEQLLVLAKDIRSDLLFIGQDSEKSYHNILAKNLLRKTSVNAVIVPNTAVAKISRIMVPIDFSEHSKKALQMAISINNQLEHPVPISAVHIYDVPDFIHYKISRSVASFQAIAKTNVEEAFDNFLSEFSPEERLFIQQELILKERPRTAGYLLEMANHKNADLVIMGIKGHSKIESLVLGSVAEKFMTINNSIPTMIVG